MTLAIENCTLASRSHDSQLLESVRNALLSSSTLSLGRKLLLWFTKLNGSNWSGADRRSVMQAVTGNLKTHHQNLIVKLWAQTTDEAERVGVSFWRRLPADINPLPAHLTHMRSTTENS